MYRTHLFPLLAQPLHHSSRYFSFYCSKNTIREIYLLKFLSVQHSTVKYRHNIVQWISCVTETLYPLDSNSPSPPPYSPGNDFTLCFYEFAHVAISYKWNHVTFVLLWLPYFLSVMSVRCIRTPFCVRSLSPLPWRVTQNGLNWNVQHEIRVHLLGGCWGRGVVRTERWINSYGKQVDWGF